MSPEQLLSYIPLIPAAGALVIPFFGNRPNARETVTLATAGLLFLAILSLL